MARAADKHLKDLCKWDIPDGGMFFWIKVKDVEDTWDMIINQYAQTKKPFQRWLQKNFDWVV